MGSFTTNNYAWKPSLGDSEDSNAYAANFSSAADTMDAALHSAYSHVSSSGESHSRLGQDVSPGATPNFNGLNITPSSGSGYSQHKLYSYSDTSWQGGYFFGYRSRGTSASQSAVVSGDYLATMEGRAWTGTTYAQAAAIYFSAGANPSSSACQGNMEFKLTDSTNAFSTVLKLDKYKKTFCYGVIYGATLTGGATTLSVDANGNIIRTPSDGRYKDNVREISYAEEQLMGLHPVSFEWNKSSGMGYGHSSHSFIAQEVLQVVPEAVSGTYGSGYSLDNGPIVALLVKQVQDLTKRMRELESILIKKNMEL